MFGYDYFDENLTLGVHTLPFKSYIYPNDPEKSIINKKVNVVYTHNGRCQCIVVEVNGKYQDFYYNGYEDCFKILSEARYKKLDSWESEDFGETPQIIKDNWVSRQVLVDLDIILPENE